MNSKYLKLPLIEVDNLDSDSILKKATEAGVYLVTDGDVTEICQVYTCENPDGTIKKWTNGSFVIDSEDVFDTIGEKHKHIELLGDSASFVPYGEYVSGETLLEIIKQITK